MWGWQKKNNNSPSIPYHEKKPTPVETDTTRNHDKYVTLIWGLGSALMMCLFLLLSCWLSESFFFQNVLSSYLLFLQSRSLSFNPCIVFSFFELSPFHPFSFFKHPHKRAGRPSCGPCEHTQGGCVNCRGKPSGFGNGRVPISPVLQPLINLSRSSHRRLVPSPAVPLPHLSPATTTLAPLFPCKDKTQLDALKASILPSREKGTQHVWGLIGFICKISYLSMYPWL